ncbi:cytochrome P450 [Pyxidicoccus sp. MSG2]|uniref:cytochrome P450 n=1 Tax=Pyxidicoccus sp. MSG2 TaxID=2996790 RepID=UPI0022720269|nr:cytochrome P450 [Pyxidicoccus sp. MSG2]MCY1022298.1 cytochrome P450 [Pyxidicoccus sp. MSG2]
MAQNPSDASAVEFNPFLPAQLEDPYPTYAKARRDAPVFFSPMFHAWIVSRYEDCTEAAKDTERFSNKVALVELPPEVKALLPIPNEAPGLVNNDPPSHTRLRALVGRMFAPQRVAKLEPHIRQVANSLVDGFAREGRADIMARFAYELPLSIIVGLCGAPLEDRHQIKRWSDAWLTLNTPGLPLEQQLLCAQGAAALYHYVAALMAQRRKEPQDDALSALLSAGTEGEVQPSEQETISTAMQLFFAGHETVTGAICNTLLHLLRHPEQLQACLREPALLPQAVEEGLRFDTSNPAMFRTAAADVELGGVRIPKGARVVLLFGSANRDETQFERPDTFDIHRSNASQHLTFGRGPHFCIGASLARLEIRIALETLFARLPNLRLPPSPELTFTTNLVLRWLKHLTVEWDPA